MNNFSTVVKAELVGKMTVSEFALKMEKSPQYIYDIFAKRNGCRWNQDLIDKACEILGLEVQFKKVKKV